MGQALPTTWSEEYNIIPFTIPEEGGTAGLNISNLSIKSAPLKIGVTIFSHLLLAAIH